MARKQSKFVERTQLDAVQAERDLLERLLMAVLNGEKDAVETFRIHGDAPGDKYRLTLYRATGADGGIVTREFVHPGQRTYATAYRLDDMRKWDRAPVEEQSAIERLFVARDAALAAKK